MNERRYARVQGFAVSATKPRHPTGKPFVERGIGFLCTRFLPGVRFSDLAMLERDVIAWRDTFANAREHEATGKVPMRSVRSALSARSTSRCSVRRVSPSA